MHKFLIATLLTGLLFGCAGQPTKPAAVSSTPTPSQACAGTTVLPPELANHFDAVEDSALLAKAIGKENQGLLCQGQVYQSKAGAKVVMFRAWNSTNPGSKLGSWWAFTKPEGRVADYRKDYEICYQWSPIDMLVQCVLKPGVKVVVGTGQSAQCSSYLTYPVSAKQQIYIEDAKSAVSDCVTFNGVLNWQVAP